MSINRLSVIGYQLSVIRVSYQRSPVQAAYL